MSKPFLFRKQILISTLPFIIVACSSNQVAITADIEQTSIQEATTSKSTPIQSIEIAEERLNKAKQEGVEFYSPLHIKQAEESITQAREYLESPPNDIKNAPLMSSIAARQYIDSAYKNKKLVEGLLTASLKHLQAIKDLNTPKILPEKYSEALESFSFIIEEIEQGSVKDAKDGEAELIQQLLALELSTQKILHLKDAETFLEQASDIDADKYAALTYQIAQAKLDDAIHFIEKNFRDRKSVKSIGLEALDAAKKAYFVALKAKELVDMGPEDAEKHTLDIMNALNRLHLAATGVTIPLNKFEDQSKALLDAIETRALDQSKMLQINTKAPTHNSKTIDTHKYSETNSADPSLLPKEDLDHSSLSAINDVTQQNEYELDLDSDEDSFDAVENISEEENSSTHSDADLFDS